MARRSIGAPLTVGIVLMLLLLALAVGWQIMMWSDFGSVTQGLRTFDWVLLVLGTLFFVLVMIGLVWLCTWLVAEVRLNQRQRAFLDAVTHEMKTPLASFRLGLETLERHQLEPEPRQQFISRMGEDLDRLDETIAQVLAAARAEERGPISWRKRGAVDLVALLESAVAEVREFHDLPEGAVRLHHQGQALVVGDAGELVLIFRNLLENAVKYSPAPMEVRVELAATADGRFRVSIRDRGIGIPSRELRKIFQRFYRVGRDVQRQVAGLGLGLFVVRSMVRKQGGKVVAESEGAGQGSRFVVTLRAHRQSTQAVPQVLGRVGPQAH